MARASSMDRATSALAHLHCHRGVPGKRHVPTHGSRTTLQRACKTTPQAFRGATGRGNPNAIRELENPNAIRMSSAPCERSHRTATPHVPVDIGNLRFASSWKSDAVPITYPCGHACQGRLAPHTPRCLPRRRRSRDKEPSGHQGRNYRLRALPGDEGLLREVDVCPFFATLALTEFGAGDEDMAGRVETFSAASDDLVVKGDLVLREVPLQVYVAGCRPWDSGAISDPSLETVVG